MLVWRYVLRGNNKTVAITESAILTAIAVIFSVIGTYVPFLTIFLVLVSVPLTIIGIRRGVKWTIISVVLTSIIGFMLTGLVNAIGIFFVSGSIAICLAYGYEKKLSTEKIVILSVLISIVSLAISFKLGFIITGIDFFETLDSSLAESMAMIQNSGAFNVPVDELTKSMNDTISTIKLVFPSLLFIAGVMNALANIVFLKAVLRRMKIKYLSAQPFYLFSFDKSFLTGMSLIMILSYIVGVMNIVDMKLLFTNVMVIVGFIFSIQGMAVMDFFLVKRKFKVGLRIAVLILLYILLNGYIFFAIIGVLDLIFNIRVARRKIN